jgi:predicted ATPase
LATSREPLTLHAEERHPVPPLALPPPGTPEEVQALAAVDAVVLFCERARAHDPSFELADGNAAAVAEICQRVDGLPLAIELAAARCGLLSAGEIAERHDQALGALGAGARDAPPRQQTLRDDRLEPRPARPRREGVLRPVRGVRRRRDGGGRRNDHRRRS